MKMFETGHTSNSVISIDGTYYLDLVPGKYNIIVAFPDGTSQTYDDVMIKRGTASYSTTYYNDQNVGTIFSGDRKTRYRKPFTHNVRRS